MKGHCLQLRPQAVAKRAVYVTLSLSRSFKILSWRYSTFVDFFKITIFNHNFEQGKNTALRLRGIDALQAALSANPLNWWLVQRMRPLAPLIERMDTMDLALQQSLTRLLLYIANVFNYVPFQELAR